MLCSIAFDLTLVAAAISVGLHPLAADGATDIHLQSRVAAWVESELCRPGGESLGANDEALNAISVEWTAQSMTSDASDVPFAKATFRNISHSSSLWRVLIDTEDAQGTTSFTDYAVLGQQSWHRTPEFLVLMDKSQTVPPTYDVTMQYHNALAMKRLFLTGGLGAFSACHVLAVEVDDTHPRPTWKATLSDNRNLVIVAKGIWDRKVGRGFVERIDVITSGASDASDSWIATDWTLDERLNVWWSREVIEERSGSSRVRYALASVSCADAEQVREACTEPGFGIADGVRGATSFTNIKNLRNGAALIALQGPQGVLNVDLNELDQAKRSNDRNFQICGWFVSAAAIVLATAARIRPTKGVTV